jgi:peptidoglycan/xylan/chitin deacetylase (PgdA/CDA1 family)
MALICACSGCGYSRSASGEQALAKPKYAAAAAVARPAYQPAAVPATQLDGRKFPDHVLAMTWDDGPDQHTVELAQYLRSRRVSGTFFVVRSWQEGLSDAPGSGPSAFETGYAHLPILKDLVRLGQRLANHTLNHVRLPSVEPGARATRAC